MHAASIQNISIRNQRSMKIEVFVQFVTALDLPNTPRVHHFVGEFLVLSRFVAQLDNVVVECQACAAVWYVPTQISLVASAQLSDRAGM